MAEKLRDYVNCDERTRCVLSRSAKMGGNKGTGKYIKNKKLKRGERRRKRSYFETLWRPWKGSLCPFINLFHNIGDA